MTITKPNPNFSGVYDLYLPHRTMNLFTPLVTLSSITQPNDFYKSYQAMHSVNAILFNEHETNDHTSCN